MSNSVRVRFAPSPTGFLHIGGVRTALFCWLYARKHRGQFLLRIEDTDLERSETRFTDDILASMKWLGLNWDEEPVYQSKRLEVYRAKAEELVAQGLAYHCNCTEEAVEEMRTVALAAGKRPQYDRSCRHKSGKVTGPSVIRLKVPLEGYVEFNDLIRGPIRVENTEVDDFVLIRSNGAPTYNLSVVVDDVYSKMTHIIRGDDHINNTPKQIHLYNYLKYPIPHFAHLPMILGTDKKKLSKRHGAVSANAYRGEGYLPEALLNFLARLGWSHGDQEIFTIQEMIDLFSFDHVQKSSAVFNLEKLLWLNGHYLRQVTPQRLAGIVVEDFGTFFTPEGLKRVDTPIGHQLISFHQTKIKLIKELAEQLVTLCTPGGIEIDASLIKWGKEPSAKPVIQAAVKRVVDQLSQKMAGTNPVFHGPWGDSPTLADAGFSHADIEGVLRQVGDEHGVKLGDLVAPMRVGVTGRAVSASVFELLTVLPWETLETRLRKVATL